MKNLKFKTNWHLPLLIAVVMALVFAFSSPTYALQLWISDGINPDIYITDNGVGDVMKTVDGVVSWAGTLGDFSGVITTGITKPSLGSATAPAFDLNTVEVTSHGTGGTLNIKVSDTGFGPLNPGLNGWTSMIHGNYVVPGTGSVTYNAYYDEDDELYGIDTGGSHTPVSIASLGPYTSGGFGDTAISANTPTLNPFSLTLDLSITHDPAAGVLGSVTTSMDANTAATPEPGTILLLGMGLLGLGVIGRKKIEVKEV